MAKRIHLTSRFHTEVVESESLLRLLGTAQTYGWLIIFFNLDTEISSNKEKHVSQQYVRCCTLKGFLRVHVRNQGIKTLKSNCKQSLRPGIKECTGRLFRATTQHNHKSSDRVLCKAHSRETETLHFFNGKYTGYCLKYSRLSLSRNRRDPQKQFEISELRHIRFVLLRKKQFEQPIFTNDYVI